MFRYSTFATLIVLSLFSIISCSKDDGDSNAIRITVSDFTVTMDENPEHAQIIGTVQSSTNQGRLTFSIIDQTPSGAISIDANSGVLTVADQNLFKYELNPEIRGTVKVANNNVSKNASVKITLSKINKVKVYDGLINLKTQAEVDAFGAEGYTHLSSTLNIGLYVTGGYSDIDDLSSLNSIISVGKNIIVGSNPNLQNLNGLDNITKLVGQLVITDNESLTNIESLRNIRDFYQSVSVIDNNRLENIDGLEFIRKAIIVNILKNASLKSLSGLSNLSEAHDLRITDNSALNNILGLNNLVSLTGGMSIGHNESLINIDGLENLRVVEDDIAIYNNNLLLNIDGLQNVNMFPRNIDIRDNNALTSISGLKGLEIISSLNINNNPALNSLEGLNNLAIVMRSLDIGRTNINNLDELNNLISARQFTIYRNSRLDNINGLINLQTVNHSFQINENPIRNLDGLSGLISLDAKLYVTNNQFLTNLCGLQPVIVQNDQITRYTVENNAYNPTKQDIIDGNCAL